MNIKRLTHLSLQSMVIIFFMIFCLYTLEKILKIEIIGEKIDIILIETTMFSYILLNLAPLSRELNEKSLKIFLICYYLSILTTLLVNIKFTFLPFLIIVSCLYSLRNVLPGVSLIFSIILISLLVSPTTYIPLFGVLCLLLFFLSLNLDVLKNKNLILPIILLTLISASISIIFEEMISFEICLALSFLMTSLSLPREFYTYRKFFIMFDLSFLITLIMVFFVIKTGEFGGLIFQSTPLFFVLYSLSLFKIARSVGVVKGNPERVFFMTETAILIQAILLVFTLGGHPLFTALATEAIILGVFFVKIHDILKIYRESIEG